jgi:hypothetical protein
MSRHRRHSRYEEDDIRESSSQQNNSPLGNFNIGSLAEIINSIDVNQLTKAINRAGEELDNDDSGDEARNADIIRALRTLINSDKSLLLQTIIQLYAQSRNQRK